MIKVGNGTGVQAVVDQQFEVGRQILAAGLVPILEPEIDIHSPSKAEAEQLLKPAILEQLGALGADQRVMLKLTLPEVDDFYADLVAHPNVLRVVALSGGYSREEANARLARLTSVTVIPSATCWNQRTASVSTYMTQTHDSHAIQSLDAWVDPVETQSCKSQRPERTRNGTQNLVVDHFGRRP